MQSTFTATFCSNMAPKYTVVSWMGLPITITKAEQSDREIINQSRYRNPRIQKLTDNGRIQFIVPIDWKRFWRKKSIHTFLFVVVQLVCYSNLMLDLKDETTSSIQWLYCTVGSIQIEFFVSSDNFILCAGGWIADRDKIRVVVVAKPAIVFEYCESRIKIARQK